jgi:hypothetical protein
VQRNWLIWLLQAFHLLVGAVSTISLYFLLTHWDNAWEFSVSFLLFCVLTNMWASSRDTCVLTRLEGHLTSNPDITPFIVRTLRRELFQRHKEP